ncbi:MAG: site-specific integrase [Lachnospiraceae bacterium]|nr:site-specific integrase [Lachnospiraceae bacterium]
MNGLQTHITNYLNYCGAQKRLTEKTLKAYRIDLKQFTEYLVVSAPSQITPAELETYIAELHRQYKPKTTKRKIASAIELLFATGMRISELCSLLP